MNSDYTHRRILVATDFSDSAEAALTQAIWLAAKIGAKIALAHGLPSHSLATPPESGLKLDMFLDFWANEGDSPEELELAASRDTVAKMRKLMERLDCSSLVEPHVFFGATCVEIIKLVEERAYDLVLIGTRGLSPWEQFLVGSTAKRLIGKCPASVWIVKAEHIAPPRVVMAATDFSEVSFKAAAEGLWLAQQANAEFHLLHVVDSSDVREDLICRIPKGSSLQQEIALEASKRMDAFIDSLAVDRPSIQVHQSWGTPWQEIRRAARFQAVDLLVMGTIGRSGLQRLLLGSTAEKILDSCDCSILTVKPSPTRRVSQAGHESS